jgi:hypothetical protein
MLRCTPFAHVVPRGKANELPWHRRQRGGVTQEGSHGRAGIGASGGQTGAERGRPCHTLGLTRVTRALRAGFHHVLSCP